jgi:RNA polymerase sigma factor (sigma-70 family)
MPQGLILMAASQGRTARRKRKPLTPEGQGLADRYVPLARSLARPFWRGWPRQRDEFESAATLALVEAAEAFDMGRNVGFATFARRRIVGSLLDTRARLKGARGTGRRTIIPEPGPLPSEDRLPTRTATDEQALEDEDQFDLWMRRLPRQYARACRLIYQDGLQQSAAAAEMGLSQSRVSSLHSTALAMLRQYPNPRAARPEC